MVALPSLLTVSPIKDPKPIAVTVSFEPVAEQSQRNRIVSPPDLQESKIVPDTNQLSDKNFATEREMIKRGMPAAGALQIPREAAPKVEAPKRQEREQQRGEKAKQAPQPPQDAEVSESPKRAPPSLRLNKDALLDTFGKVDSRAQAAAQAQPKPQPFSRAIGSGAAFFGSGGSPDYLPSLPDGDMTMLNAKASKYATFVRRVAVQVFAALRTQGWESLSGSEINSAGASTLARASLDKKGNLISVQIVERSGSPGFDSVLASSIRSGARDPNPPPEAAADDGTYRFIFEARSWAVRSSDPRTGAPSERRWLMLGTGLE